MPEIEIRAANTDDIHALTALDHNFASDYVWQMDIQKDELVDPVAGESGDSKTLLEKEPENPINTG